MTAAVLGLGANLGDPRGALSDAVVALATDDDVRVTAVSGLWRTAPVGGPEQPAYHNAVVAIETSLSPEELLALARRLESAAGRVRGVRWGPRTLDVDILDVAGFVSDAPEFTVPHPRAHERAFVLAPWAQATPAWVLTPAGGIGAPVAQWAQRASPENLPGRSPRSMRGGGGSEADDDPAAPAVGAGLRRPGLDVRGVGG